MEFFIKHFRSKFQDNLINYARAIILLEIVMCLMKFFRTSGILVLVPYYFINCYDRLNGFIVCIMLLVLQLLQLLVQLIYYGVTITGFSKMFLPIRRRDELCRILDHKA